MTKEMINDLVSEIKNEVFDFYKIKLDVIII
jgi:hypothetical protein